MHGFQHGEIMKNKNSLKNLNRNENAVSPVIGVILMVAITVILASVIAVFVFSMAPPKQAPSISAKLEVNGTSIDIRHSGGDEIYWNEITVTAEGIGNASVAPTNGTLFVGQKATIVTNASGVVRVIGVHRESQQTLFDTKVRV